MDRIWKRVGQGEPMIRYFAPLTKWLKQQNKGKTCGW